MSVRRALRFTSIATAVNFLISLLSVIVISRLLTPAEIGIFSVAVSLIAYTHILREFGVGQYFVQLKELTREHLRAGFTVMLAVSWSIASLLLLLRAPASQFYNHTGLTEVLTVLAVNFVILPFGSPILSVLKREMQFGRLAVVNVVNTVIQVTVTISTAYAGESYMSMAWGSLAGNIANVVLLSVFRRDLALLLPTAKGLKAVLSFGSKASGSSLVGQLGASGPDLVLGKTLGFEAVANFSRGASLNNMILGKVISVIGQIFLPAFAEKLRQGYAPSNLYCNSMILITGITVPLLGYLTLLAKPLILFFFGAQWYEAAYLATFLCLAQLLRAPIIFAANALMAGGYPSEVLRSECVIQGMTIMILMLSLWLTLEHVVYLLVVARLFDLAVYFRALKKCYSITPCEIIVAVWPSYLLLPLTLVGPGIILALDHIEFLSLDLQSIVFASTALAAVGYVGSLRLAKHPVREELVRMVPLLSRALGQKPRTFK